MSFSIKPIAPLLAARLFIDKISKPARILVAVSGGSDSTGLLIALHRAVQDTKRTDISLVAVTIDHALRPESAKEASDVAALCASIGISHHSRRWSAEKPSTGISSAARLARYALIGAVADEIAADMVVVGHTLGDQQETIAMRAARSVREDNLGLAGMADAVLYGARHWIFRPFLRSTRQDIRNFLEVEGYGWVEDPSNDDAKYERVRVRQASLPDDPKSDGDARRLGLSLQAASFIARYVQSFSVALVRIERQGLSEDVFVLRHALSALSSVIGGRRFVIAADSMDKVMAFIAKGEPGRVTAGRVIFDRRKDGLYLMRENRNIPSVEIAAGKTVIWDERFEITNASAADAVVRAGRADEGEGLPQFVPPGIAKRVFQAMPVIETGGAKVTLSGADGVAIRPVLAPYDLFLPRFDLELASAIAHLLQCRAYPQPPV